MTVKELRELIEPWPDNATIMHKSEFILPPPVADATVEQELHPWDIRLEGNTVVVEWVPK